MIVAVDQTDDTAVSIDDLIGDPQPPQSDYTCLFCETAVELVTTASTPEQFVHPGTCCVDPSGASETHYATEQIVAKHLYNWIPSVSGEVSVDLERRVGGSSDFVIADVRIQSPIQLVVEVVYRTSSLGLRRRFKTLFASDYAGMILTAPGSSVSADWLEQQLNQVGDIEIGYIDPDTASLSPGSIITPEVVDLQPAAWDRVSPSLA